MELGHFVPGAMFALVILAGACATILAKTPHG